MKKIFLILFVIASTLNCICNNQIEPDLYYKYVENFFTFQGNRYYLSDKYVKQYNCGDDEYKFDSTITNFKFFNDCSSRIIDGYNEYVDQIEIDNNTNKDSARQEIIKKVKNNIEFKQCFYSIYCQYYNIKTDTLFGIKLFKKERLSMDSLENIALLSLTCDAVDSIERFTISHFCVSIGSKEIKNISTKIIYYDVANAIHNDDVKEIWRKTIGILNQETKSKIIDGENIEDIRKKVEYKLRKEIKESGLLSKAIRESYEKNNYKPYIIQ
jgi:hypothetical protein